jgi:penicillin-binding protein 1C
MRDNWCIGFSERYTVGVWVGNASGALMWDVSGVTGAAPIWQEIMHYLHKDSQPVRAGNAYCPMVLSNVTSVFPTRLKPPEMSCFKRNSAGQDCACAFRSDTDKNNLSQIGNDRRRRSGHSAGTAAHALCLRGDGQVLVLDGQRLKTMTVISSQQEKTLRYDWFPIPGKHVLSLLTPQGLLLDQVSFEVRGATLVSNKKRANAS